jgi:NTP pyrophosphatase (non-canonical NTP hydrolase)
MQNILESYSEFVNVEKLSEDGYSVVKLLQTINKHDLAGVDFTRLLCGAIGQSAESGELLVEMLKPMSPKVIDELGDVIFYTMVSARALNVKLSHFYYNESFDDIQTKNPVEITQLIISLTAEYLDIIKKILFQSKDIDSKLYKQLIDKIWMQYGLIQLLSEKLEVSIEYVILVNKNKLNKRFKTTFTKQESENR